MELENEILLSTINQLEMCLKIHQIRSDECMERGSTVEMEGGSLHVEERNLRSVIHSKTVEVEAQKAAQAEL